MKLTVDQIESLIGTGAGAWDMVDPQMLIDTISAAAIRELVPYMKGRAAQLVDQMPLTTEEAQNDGAWRRDVRQLLKMVSFLPSDHEVEQPTDEVPDIPMTSDFVRDISRVINSHSKENGSNTPDFILARLLAQNLAVFDEAVNARGRWSKAQLPDDAMILDFISEFSGRYTHVRSEPDAPRIPSLREPNMQELVLRIWKNGFNAALPRIEKVKETVQPRQGFPARGEVAGLVPQDEFGRDMHVEGRNRQPGE